VPALGARIFLETVPGATGRSLVGIGHYAFIEDAGVQREAAAEATDFFARVLARPKIGTPPPPRSP